MRHTYVVIRCDHPKCAHSVSAGSTAEANALAQRAGWLQRQGRQFHWENEGYPSFEAFLDGDMTCQEGVDLFIAARRAAEAELVLFEATDGTA